MDGINTIADNNIATISLDNDKTAKITFEGNNNKSFTFQNENPWIIGCDLSTSNNGIWTTMSSIPVYKKEETIFDDKETIHELIHRAIIDYYNKHKNDMINDLEELTKNIIYYIYGE